MRRIAATCLLTLGLAGCGGGGPSPETVVRAWSSALNEGDNAAAAALFATGAEVVQGPRVLHFATRAQAEAWNTALPCSGRIVRLRARGERVSATFLLGDRGPRRCDAPGGEARAVFRVHDGKIVLWHQLPQPATPDSSAV